MRRFLLTSLLGMAAALLSCAPKEPPAPPDIVINTQDLAGTERELRRKIAGGPPDARAHLALAEVLILEDRVSEGVIHFDLARQINPSLGARILETRKRLARDLADKGRTAFSAGDLDAASEALTQANMIDATDPMTSILRGEIAQAQGHSEEALTQFEKAKQRSEDRETQNRLREALVSSARTAVEGEDPETALTYLREAQSLQSSPDIDYLIGTVAYSLANKVEPTEAPSHLQEASEAFTRVLRAHPDDQDAAYNLGAVLLAQNRYREAADLYYDLLKHHPKDGELYQALSMAHGRLGDTERALAENAAGQALRADEPVDDPLEWALRSARRFPGSDLEDAWREMGPPNAVYTFQGQSHSLTELWCYWSDKRLLVFREGGLLGEPVSLEPAPGDRP